jgi:hypothetical protein
MDARNLRGTASARHPQRQVARNSSVARSFAWWVRPPTWSWPLFLYRAWLAASGEEARDFPLFCQRVTFFLDVPRARRDHDVYLPLK